MSLFSDYLTHEQVVQAVENHFGGMKDEPRNRSKTMDQAEDRGSHRVLVAGLACWFHIGMEFEDCLRLRRAFLCVE